MSRRASKKKQEQRAAVAWQDEAPRMRSTGVQPDPGRQFRKIAQETIVAKPSADFPGALLCVAQPQRTREFEWHRPLLHVPELQWQAATGETRYEFERQHTPEHQRDLFMRLQQRYQVEGPPPLPTEDLWKRVAGIRERSSTLPNGLPGEDLGEELYAELRRLTIIEYSPDGQWSFIVQAVRMAGEVADRLDVKHRDYRTVADWSLLVRFRSWVLQDDRNAFMILPMQDIHADGWQRHYENDTPNNLQWISPRRPQQEEISALRSNEVEA